MDPTAAAHHPHCTTPIYLWTDEISLLDFSQWVELSYNNSQRANQKPTIGALHMLTIRMQVRKLMNGDGIAFLVADYRCKSRFYRNVRVTLGHDFQRMQELANAFQDKANTNSSCSRRRSEIDPLLLQNPIELLKLYKQAIYPGVVKARMELFRVFLATTKRSESPSSVLGNVGPEGVMRNIYEFVFPVEQKEVEAEA